MDSVQGRRSASGYAKMREQGPQAGVRQRCRITLHESGIRQKLGQGDEFHVGEMLLGYGSARFQEALHPAEWDGKTRSPSMPPPS
jgi:hypothetical protein